MTASASVHSSSLAQSKTQLARSRFMGRVSAVIFFVAALAVLDALQTLVRHEFNSIDLVNGESTLVSGMLPADINNHEDLVVHYEGADCVTLTPVETYKGFWMGGHMWRAKLTALPGCESGKALVTVEDIIQPKSDTGNEKQSFDQRDRSILYGGQQNPALVFAVTIWPSDSAMREGDNSLFRRFTGFPAFGVAAVCVALAIVVGIANWRFFSLAEKGLADHGLFFIHGVKRLQPEPIKDKPGEFVKGPRGYKASVAKVGQPFARGDGVVLLNQQWQPQAEGRVMEVDSFKAHALFSLDGVRPQYGWLLAKAPYSSEETGRS